jgi:AAA domain
VTATGTIELPGLGPAMDVHDWLMVVPDTPWLFRGRIACQSLNMVKASREVGKTLLVAEATVAYVKGETEWLGGQYDGPEDRGNVFWMVTDANAEAEVSQQLTNLGAPKGRVQLARHSGEIKGSAEDWMAWGAWLQGVHGVSVLVVDNGTGMTNGVVDTEASGALFKRLRAMTGPMGLTVILIHHEKNSGGTAGNYSWESETRWRLRLSCPSGKPLTDDYRELSIDGGNILPPDDVPLVTPLRMPRRTHKGSRFTMTERRNTTPEQRSEKRREDHGDKFKTLMEMGGTWANYAEMGAAISASASQAERIVKGHGHVRDRATGMIVPKA